MLFIFNKKVMFFMMVFGLHLNFDAAITKTITPGGNPWYGSCYFDEFGPLNSNYSMGDFVRYTVTPSSDSSSAFIPMNPVNDAYVGKSIGYNIYYNMVEIPYALDIFQYNQNTHNLYNFIGYLYAGYAAVNFYFGLNGLRWPLLDKWLTEFRTPTEYFSRSQQVNNNINNVGSLLFDNNVMCNYTIPLRTDFFINQISFISGGLRQDNVDMDHGRHFLQAENKGQQFTKASGSCSWNTNNGPGCYVLAFSSAFNNAYFKSNGMWADGYAAPYGQFFGARIAHILGAVVNDVPTTTEIPTTVTATSSTVFGKMPTGTPFPQMAIMKGGPYTATTAPINGITPSTAHFGTLSNFLTAMQKSFDLSSITKKSIHYQYLINHLLPVVQRFATGGSAATTALDTTTSSAPTPLSFYQINQTLDDRNLIEIISDDVTPYDNGVIVDLVNDTGDQLQIRQITSTANATIGTLQNKGSNNFFLHTGSLMNGGASSAGSDSAASLPLSTNLIQIQDTRINAQSGIPNLFIQIATAAQVASMLASVNSALNALSAGDALNYNGGSSATASNSAQYLVMTNFNPNLPINSNLAAAYRIQAIDISQFNNQPYFVTLQIRKENLGYGIGATSPIAINDGASGVFMLQGSFVSVKICTWLNPFAQAQVATEQSPSAIPLLLLPDSITNFDLPGLKAHYGIWLMSYAAALTEFVNMGKFGNRLDVLKNSFELFSVSKQQPPARCVIDASGQLASGQVVPVNLKTIAQNNMLDNQITASYVSLIGSDVWDGGMNQDIPILNLYTDPQTNDVVCNQNGGNYINFEVTFDTLNNLLKGQADTFANLYGQPYANIMLFSLPTNNMNEGVLGVLTHLKQAEYLLTFYDQQKPKANVLAFQKVSLTGKLSNMNIGYLNNADKNWNSTVSLAEVFENVGIGKTKSFTLKSTAQGDQNRLQILTAQKNKNFKKKTGVAGPKTKKLSPRKVVKKSTAQTT